MKEASERESYDKITKYEIIKYQKDEKNPYADVQRNLVITKKIELDIRNEKRT